MRRYMLYETAEGLTSCD